MPIIRQSTIWLCNICNGEYSSYDKAIDCEAGHNLSRKTLSCSFEKVKKNILTLYPKYYFLSEKGKRYVISDFTDSQIHINNMYNYMEEQTAFEISDNVKEIVYITGRGNVAVLKKPNTFIKLNDRVLFNNKTYLVTGIESSKGLENQILGMGLLIKEE